VSTDVNSSMKYFESNGMLSECELVCFSSGITWYQSIAIKSKSLVRKKTVNNNTFVIFV
jgi:hypothetical protein